MSRAALVLLAGCGRVGFEGVADATVDDAAPVLALCDRVPDALFCEDFEAGALPPAVDETGGGFVDGGGWLGSRGYRFTAAPGAMPLLRIPLAPALSDGALHIGARLLVEGTEATEDFVVLAQATSPDFTKVSLDMNGGNRLQLVSFVTGNGVGAQAGDNTFPRDRWFCFELRIAIAEAGAGGSIDVLIDGVQALAGWSDDDTLPDDGFVRVDIGPLSSDDNTRAVTATYDNWIVSRAPIGCP